MKFSHMFGTSEAARRLNLSRARVKVLARDKRIGRLVAGRYLFTREELDSFSQIKRPTGKRLQSA